jgi:hypothetical protein
VGGAAGLGGCDRVGGVDKAGVFGGGDSGGAAGLRMGPSALELLTTAKDRHARCGGATETGPTFTLMEGMDGARDIAAALEPRKRCLALVFLGRGGGGGFFFGGGGGGGGREGRNAWRRFGHTHTPLRSRCGCG